MTQPYQWHSDGAWEPATSVTISVNDPDANKNPTSAETLDIGDETEVIPTIKMGSPLTLAMSGIRLIKSWLKILPALQQQMERRNSRMWLRRLVVQEQPVGYYTLTITNVTDNSERLRIIHSASGGSMEHQQQQPTLGLT